ncbi:MAG: hypothetical protein K5647_06605 [Clostridiales bacterium]|nr:hypothetical protein [Clostridiales bacterium]
MKLYRLAALLAAAALLLSGCGYIILENYETRGTASAATDPVFPELTLAPKPVIPAVFEGRREPRTDEAKARLEALYSVDLSSADVLVAVSTDADDSLFGDEEDPFTEYYAMRNELVTGKYGFSITVIRESSETMRAGLAASIGSGGGSYYSDVIEAPAALSGSFAVSGLLMNLRKLPFYEIPSSGFESCGVYGTSCYFDISPATEGYASRPALYLNTSLAGRELSDRLALAAINGSFDFDGLLGAVAEASLPDGTDGLAVSFGNAGYAGIADIAAARLGISFTERVSGYPTVTFVDSGGAERLTSLLMSLREISLINNPVEGSDPALDAFREGRALFYVGKLSDIAVGLKNEKVSWEILPIPQGDGPVSYTLSSPDRAVFTVPANNRRTESTSMFLSGVGAASGNWIADYYANYCLDSGLFRENNSYFTLLSLIDDPVYFDFVYICGDECKSLREATVLAARICALSGTPVADTASPLLADLAKAIKKISLKQ